MQIVAAVPGVLALITVLIFLPETNPALIEVCIVFCKLGPWRQHTADQSLRREHSAAQRITMEYAALHAPRAREPCGLCLLSQDTAGSALRKLPRIPLRAGLLLMLKDRQLIRLIFERACS